MRKVFIGVAVLAIVAVACAIVATAALHAWGAPQWDVMRETHVWIDDELVSGPLVALAVGAALVLGGGAAVIGIVAALACVAIVVPVAIAIAIVAMVGAVVVGLMPLVVPALLVVGPVFYSFAG